MELPDLTVLDQAANGRPVTAALPGPEGRGFSRKWMIGT